MKYVVSSQEKPQNFPIYSMHSDMDSFILYNTEIQTQTDVKMVTLSQDEFLDKESTVQIQEILENNKLTVTIKNPMRL